VAPPPVSDGTPAIDVSPPQTAAGGSHAPSVHDAGVPTTPWSPATEQTGPIGPGTAGTPWLKPVAAAGVLVVVLAVIAAVIVLRPKDTTIVTSEPPGTSAPLRHDTTGATSAGRGTVA